MREQRVQLAVVERDGRLLGIVTLTDVVARVLPEATAQAGAAGASGRSE
jgi:CBS domain-containing protein